MGVCPTITVLLKDGGKDPVVINESDYDEAIHKRVMVKKDVDSSDDPPDDGGDGGEKGKSKKEAK